MANERIISFNWSSNSQLFMYTLTLITINSESEKVINTTNYLLQLAMVGSYQQLHVSAFMEATVRLCH